VCLSSGITQHLAHSSFRSSGFCFDFKTLERKQLFYLEKGYDSSSVKAPSEEADHENYTTWSRCSDMVYFWIVNTPSLEISNNGINYVLYCS